jgi:hypothetical protein
VVFLGVLKMFGTRLEHDSPTSFQIIQFTRCHFKESYMKYIAALICLLLTSIAPSTFAVPSNDCAARSEKVAATERDDFLKSCLAEASAPHKVKEAKQKHQQARCEQNAKNMKLQGKEKGSYQEECINKNEAAVVAESMPKAGTEISEKPATEVKANNDSQKSSSQKHVEKKHVAKKQKEHKKSTKKKVVKLSPAASGVAETK